MRNSNPWAIMLFLVVLAWAANNLLASAQEVGPGQCKDEIRKGISSCKAVAMGQLPSPACFARVRVSHPECVCPLVTPEVAAMVDPKKAKKLIEGCGRKVPPHFQC